MFTDAAEDVIAPPADAEGGLFCETNDNSVAVLLTTALSLSSWLASPAREEAMSAASTPGF